MNRTSFFGIPIEGTPSHPHQRLPQRPAEELLMMLSQVWVANREPVTCPTCGHRYSRISGLVWEQYTPFYDGGDNCVFRAHEPRFLLPSDCEETDEEYGWLISRHEKQFTGLCPQLRLPLERLNTAWDSFTMVLLEFFGDHARVVARPEKFVISTYEHG